MEHEEYLSYWAQIEGVARVKLRQLARALQGKTSYTPGEAFLYGKAEYQMALPLHCGNDVEYVALALLTGELRRKKFVLAGASKMCAPFKRWLRKKAQERR